MTTPPGETDGSPSLPAAQPAEPSGSSGSSGGVPTLPPAAPVAPPEEPEFDARAMVESTRGVSAAPAYGALPEATPESREAATKLRAQARRKRRRNKVAGWLVALLFLGVVITAGFFAYRAYQDEQDDFEASREAAQEERDRAGDPPAALTPLGEQQEVLEGLEVLNDTPQVASGGLLDVVDQAQEAVDDLNGSPGAPLEPPPAPAAFAVADVLPASAVAVGTRLNDLDGFERYVIESAEVVWADAPEYRSWFELMRAQPQVGPESPEFAILPPIRKGEVGIAVQRDGERVVRAVVIGVSPDLHVVIG